VWFDLQRVEVTGIWAKDDQTQTRFPGMFDDHRNPSFFEKQKGGWIESLRQIFSSKGDDDLSGLQVDRDGKLSQRGKEALQPLVGKQINELVAHSWGTEMVYNAIFEGFIMPPARIVVLGAPDNDYAKWEILAKHTGTDVIYLRFPGDFVARSGALRKSAIGKEPVGLDLLWFQKCSRPDWTSRCRREGVPTDYKGKVANLSGVKKLNGYSGHDRHGYYEELRRLEPHFAHTSAADLAKPQTELIVKETEKIRGGVEAQALQLIEIAVGSEGYSEAIQGIRAGAKELERRKNSESRSGGSGGAGIGLGPVARAAAPGAQAAPKLPQAQVSLERWEEANTPPLDRARWLARIACENRVDISQDTMDRLTERLFEYMKNKAFPAEPQTTCAAQIYDKILSVSRLGKRLNVAWVMTRAAQRHCVDISRDSSNSMYRSMVSLALKACSGQSLGSSEIHDVFTGASSLSGGYYHLSGLQQCAQDVYFLLCAGDENGSSWSAERINGRAKELAARDARETSSSYVDPGGASSDRVERLQSHDFSRPNALIPTIRSPW
jgi:hypothetical protein